MLIQNLITLLFVFDVGQCINRWDVFSTKTIYEWAHGVQIPSANKHYYASVDSNVCKAVHVNMVVRHGARNPTSNSMKHIKTLHEKIVKSKDPAVFQELNNWKYRYDNDREGELVSTGMSEQNDLGARTGARFQHLFDKNGKYVKFMSSRRSRAKDSAKYFHGGLSDFMTDKIPSFDNEINNATMRFYDGCYNYENQVDNNVSQFEQLHKFSEVPEFINITISLRSKLRLGTFSLTNDDVYLINELCSYEKYLYNETTWCQLITDEERKVLEYGKDIEKYYEASYGHPINSQMTCPLVKDMFDTMDKAMNHSWDYENLGNMNNSGYLAAKFQFGHGKTMIHLMTALGLYEDTKQLLAANYKTMYKRRFQTSHIVPYSANVAFVIYACDEEVNSPENVTMEKEKRKFVAKLFVNEEEVIIPACDRFFCYYDIVKEYYKNYINNCNINAICGTKPDDPDNMANNICLGGLTKQLVMLTVVLLLK